MPERFQDLGLQAARERFSLVVHDAVTAGTVTYLTQHGKRMGAAIVPTSLLELAVHIRDAEQRTEFRRKMDASSLGAPEVKVAIARTRRRGQALPERWTQLSQPDLTRLLDHYRERRETYHEDHADAVATVLAEVDFEPDHGDLDEKDGR